MYRKKQIKEIKECIDCVFDDWFQNIEFSSCPEMWNNQIKEKWDFLSELKHSIETKLDTVFYSKEVPHEH